MYSSLKLAKYLYATKFVRPDFFYFLFLRFFCWICHVGDRKKRKKSLNSGTFYKLLIKAPNNWIIPSNSHHWSTNTSQPAKTPFQNFQKFILGIFWGDFTWTFWAFYSFFTIRKFLKNIQKKLFIGGNKKDAFWDFIFISIFGNSMSAGPRNRE